MSQYGAEAWKSYNNILQKMVDNAMAQLTDIKYVKPAPIIKSVAYICVKVIL